MIEFVNVALTILSTLLGIAFLCLLYVKLEIKEIAKKNTKEYIKTAEWWQLLFMFLAGVAFCSFGVSKMLPYISKYFLSEK